MTSPSLEERLRTATAERFEILGLLGRGGMARVFRARDRTLGREVAIKVLSDEVLSDESSVERFLEEARAVAALDHPNIVKVFSVEQHEGLYCLVLQLIHGRSLAQILKRGRLLDVGMVERWFGQIADAVDYSHRCGIIHRDIKPGNVLIRDTGEAVLTDFGIAKAAARPSLTRTGFVIGTPDYMSPEQCNADPESVRPASDQYSIGVVLYEALSGTNPFSGRGNQMVAVSKQMETVAPPLIEVRSEVPAELSAAVQRMLAKNPHDRFDSVSAAARAAGCVRDVPRRRAGPVPSSGVPDGTGPSRESERTRSGGGGVVRAIGTYGAWLLVPLGIWGAVSLASRAGSPPPVPVAADSVIPDSLVVEIPDSAAADSTRPGLEVPVGGGGARSTGGVGGVRQAAVPATGVLVLGRGSELFTALSFERPLPGDLWCAGLSLAVNGMPVREVERTQLRATGARQARLLTDLDSLAASDDGPLPVVETEGVVRMWEGNCPPSGSMPHADMAIELPALCAQRMLSGAWFPCR